MKLFSRRARVLGNAGLAALGMSFDIPAFAAEDGGTVDFYAMIAHALHVDHKWVPTIGGLCILALITILGILYRSTVQAGAKDVAPSGRFGLTFIVESILDVSASIAKDNTAGEWKKYMPFLSGLFVFILLCNLTGLVPGFHPATMSMDTNVAMGILVFLVYNWAGLKEHGFGYVKHFLGPVAFIAPLFFAIELVSHGSRPLSLGLRLMGNIYGDHTLLGVFASLTYVVVPSLLMFFGLLVAAVQSFVFTLLTGIYISMAISHDH